jgi:hypothetical protein
MADAKTPAGAKKIKPEEAVQAPKGRALPARVLRMVGGWIGFTPAIDVWDREEKLHKKIKHSTGTAWHDVVWKWLALFGTGDIIQTVKNRKTLGAKGTAGGIFSALADQAAGRTVRPIIKAMTFIVAAKVLTITAIAALIGGSFLATVGVTALAFGLSTAVYESGKELFKNRKRKKEEKVKILSQKLLVKTGVAFGKGMLFGTAGSWLIHTETGQSLLNPVRHVIGNGVNSLMEAFNLKAVPLPKILPPITPVPPLEPPSETIRTRAPARPVPAPI